MVEGQVQAAYTYQDWAVADPDKAAYFKLAMTGSKQHKEIWGWLNIAKRVVRVPRYRPVLHEALYNMVVCRKAYALSKKGEARTKLLKQAVRDLNTIVKRYAKMTDEQYDKYNKLLGSIQKLLGQKVKDLKLPVTNKPKP